MSKKLKRLVKNPIHLLMTVIIIVAGGVGTVKLLDVFADDNGGYTPVTLERLYYDRDPYSRPADSVTMFRPGPSTAVPGWHLDWYFSDWDDAAWNIYDENNTQLNDWLYNNGHEDGMDDVASITSGSFTLSLGYGDDGNGGYEYTGNYTFGPFTFTSEGNWRDYDWESIAKALTDSNGTSVYDANGGVPNYFQYYLYEVDSGQNFDYDLAYWMDLIQYYETQYGGHVAFTVNVSGEKIQLGTISLTQSSGSETFSYSESSVNVYTGGPVIYRFSDGRKITVPNLNAAEAAGSVMWMMGNDNDYSLAKLGDDPLSPIDIRQGGGSSATYLPMAVVMQYDYSAYPAYNDTDHMGYRDPEGLNGTTEEQTTEKIATSDTNSNNLTETTFFNLENDNSYLPTFKPPQRDDTCPFEYWRIKNVATSKLSDSVQLGSVKNYLSERYFEDGYYKWKFLVEPMFEDCYVKLTYHENYYYDSSGGKAATDRASSTRAYIYKYKEDNQILDTPIVPSITLEGINGMKGTDGVLFTAAHSGDAFLNWTEGGDADVFHTNGTARAAGSTMADVVNNVDLYAQWQIQKYVIKYNYQSPTSNNNDVLVKSGDTDITAQFHENITISQDPGTNDPYVGVAADSNFFKGTEGYAINQFPYYTKNGDTWELQTTYSGLQLDLTESAKSGFNGATVPSFDHWSLSKNGAAVTSVKTGDFTKVDDETFSVTVYGVWNQDQYTLRYNENKPTDAGTVAHMPDPSSVTLHSADLKQDGGYTLYSSPVPTESSDTYTFKGWSLKADGTEADKITALTWVQFLNGEGNTTLTNGTTIDVYAIWVNDNVTLTYHANDDDHVKATGSVPARSSVETGGSVTVSGNTDSLARVGYTFQGWTAAADGSGTVYQGGETFTLDSNADLYAKWTPITYTLQYNENKSLLKNSAITVEGMPSTPVSLDITKFTKNTDGKAADYVYTLSDYTYSAWYDAGAGKTAAGYSPTAFAHEFQYWSDEQSGAERTGLTANEFDAKEGKTFTLYAQWSPLTYQLSYNANPTTAMQSVHAKVVYTTGHEVPETLTLDASHFVLQGGNWIYPDTAKYLTADGFTFKGWSKESGAGSGDNPITLNIASDFDSERNCMVYATWAVKTYTVTYDANGVTQNEALPGDESFQITSDKLTGGSYQTDGKYVGGKYAFTGGTLTTNDLFAFKGWNTDSGAAEGLDPRQLNFDASQNTYKLYAIWEPLYDLKYTNGGHGSAANIPGNELKLTYDDIKSDGKALSSQTPTDTGYTFAGWKISYTSAGTPVETTLHEGEAVPTAAFTVSRRTVTAVAQWTANPYTVTYVIQMPDGATDITYAPSDSAEYHINDTVILQADPTDPDNYDAHKYTFEWVSVVGNTSSAAVTLDSATRSFTMPAENVKVTGRFIANASYKVSYTVTGDVPASYSKPGTVSYYENDPVTVAGVPSVPGYTFTGWTLPGDVTVTAGVFPMPKKNVEITGEFKKIEYKVHYKANRPNDGTTTAVEHMPATPEAFTVTDITASGGKQHYAFKGETASGDKPATSGYRFVGWGLTANATEAQKVTQIEFNANTTEYTVYAIWENWTYRVYYEPGAGHNTDAVKATMPAGFTTDGTEQAYPDPQEFLYGKVFMGDALISNAVPTDSGYVFTGWKIRDSKTFTPPERPFAT